LVRSAEGARTSTQKQSLRKWLNNYTRRWREELAINLGAKRKQKPPKVPLADFSRQAAPLRA